MQRYSLSLRMWLSVGWIVTGLLWVGNVSGQEEGFPQVGDEGSAIEVPVVPEQGMTEPEEAFGEGEEEEPEEEEEIETDRDSFTPATTVVGRKRVIVEGSYSYIQNRSAAESHSFPELLTRVGISDRMEFRLGWNYEMGGGGSVSSAGSTSEEEPLGGESEEEGNILYGVKTLLTEQEGWIPQSAVIVHATTPTSGPETATQFTTGYVAGWKLANSWVLDGSLRYSADSEEGDHFNLWAPSVVMKVPLGEKWTTHIEYFGIMSQKREEDRESHYASPGIHYLIRPNFEVGVRTGWGMSPDSANFFSNVGAGYLF